MSWTGRLRARRSAPATSSRSSKSPRTTKVGCLGLVSILLTGHKDWKKSIWGDLAPEGDPEVGKEQEPLRSRSPGGGQSFAGPGRRRKQRNRAGGHRDPARAKTRTHLYVEALRQFGLTPYVVAGRGFWNTREAIELRALLAVIANPLDDNNLLGALTSPACGLSSDALWLAGGPLPWKRPLWPTLASVARTTPLPDQRKRRRSRTPPSGSIRSPMKTARSSRLRRLVDSLRLRAAYAAPLRADRTDDHRDRLRPGQPGPGPVGERPRNRSSRRLSGEGVGGRRRQGPEGLSGLGRPQRGSRQRSSRGDRGRSQRRRPDHDAAKGLEFKVAWCWISVAGFDNRATISPCASAARRIGITRISSPSGSAFPATDRRSCPPTNPSCSKRWGGLLARMKS